MKKWNKRYSRVITAFLLTLALVAGTFTVLPEKAYAASASDIQVGDFVDIGKTDAAGYTGIPHWRVIDKKDDGSMLLMSEGLWSGNGSDNPDAKISFTTGPAPNKEIGVDWNDTLAWKWCNDFESAVLSDIEGLTIKSFSNTDPEYSYTQILEDSPGNSFEFSSIYVYDTVYFLSAEEAVRYLTDEAGKNQPAKRVANLPVPTEYDEWLLRSTETSAGRRCASKVRYDGELSNINANQGAYARPVFWAQFAEGTSFVSATDESGAKTWTIGEDQTDPSGGDQPVPSGGGQSSPADAQKAAEEHAKATTSVAVSGKTVTADSISAAIAAAGGRPEYVTEIVLDKSVKKISKSAFAGTNVTRLIVKTKKLTKKSVKGSLKGSSVKTVKVQVGKAKVNKKYVKKYKKIFTKKNAGKKAKVIK